MRFVYIHADGRMEQSTLPPLHGDWELIKDGQLTVLRIDENRIEGLTVYGPFDLWEYSPDAHNMYHTEPDERS